jgi:C-terminal processing protease CtpA/Prc
MVGHYPTAGLGGVIDSFLMPEEETVTFTVGRSVDMNGEIHIEGMGIAPTIDVPVTEETLFSKQDPLLEAAIAYLDEAVKKPVLVPSTP